MVKNLKKTETKWDKMAEWWNQEVGEKGVWHQRNSIDPVVFKKLGNIKNKVILEIGCGNGYFTRLLAKKGAKVTGIDLSRKLIAFALKREKSKPFGIKYLVRNAAKLYGLKSRSFDIVIANMCLMDIADAQGTIKEASRVLKKNGYFLFSITHPVFNTVGDEWTILKAEDGKKYFARAIYKYLSSVKGTFNLWASGIQTDLYHRSIQTYFKYLLNSGFLINEFIEIPTKKKVTKATKQDGNMRIRSSKYTTLFDKKIKESAGKEIPLFLIIGALKIERKKQ